MKVLIVDDSASMRKTISKIVTTKGFVPLEASNGAEALAKLRKSEQDIALVVLDWNMPIMDGYTMLVKMRSHEEFDRIPVIMATSEGVREEVMKAINAGANGYMIKPFTSEDLSGKISEILHMKIK